MSCAIWRSELWELYRQQRSWSSWKVSVILSTFISRYPGFSCHLVPWLMWADRPWREEGGREWKDIYFGGKSSCTNHHNLAPATTHHHMKALRPPVMLLLSVSASRLASLSALHCSKSSQLGLTSQTRHKFSARHRSTFRLMMSSTGHASSPRWAIMRFVCETD